MVVQPGIEVNRVIHPAPPEADAGHAELIEQGDANTQVGGCLLLGQTARRRQRQTGGVHVRVPPWPGSTGYATADRVE